MAPANLTQVLMLFLVMVVIASATSHPFRRSRSRGLASKHDGFEWNARRVGSRRVATISIRKEEERDRRSIPLADDDDDDTQTHHTLHHSHHHHHPGHHPPAGDASSQDSRHSIRSVPHHRHHHGEEAAEDLGWPTDEGDGGGEIEERTEHEEDDLWEELEEDADENILLSSERELVLSETRTETEDANKMLEFLSTVGVDPKVLRNYTQMLERRREKKEAKSERSKKKKRSKKVKRERKRKKNKDKKKKKKKKGRGGRGGRRRCRGLTGKEKKQCRAETQKSREEVVTTQPPPEPPVTTQPPPEPPIILSGSDACLFKNLEECSRKVGLLEAHQSQRTVERCNNREKFFDCMEEQRTEACNPSFEIEGNVKALRKQIRDAFHTTNSCLISEVIEG